MKEEDLSYLRKTPHALRRFEERFIERFGYAPVCPEQCLAWSLTRVVEVVGRPQFVVCRSKRRRSGSRVRFYLNHIWCFVVNCERTKLITVFLKPQRERRPVKKDNRRRYFV
jgi:hypothetical protein